MLHRPLLYDLCCGEGGVAHAAISLGWDVVGVDHVPQPHYPGKFILADALNPPLAPGADLVWCSPPCQGYSRFIYTPAKWTTPKLVHPIREVARSLGNAYVIENLQDCHELIDPIRLCGFMFGLPLIRHRRFECSFTIPQPAHTRHGQTFVSVAGNYKGTLDERQKAMFLPQLTREGLCQAVPYPYTTYILRWFQTNYQVSTLAIA